MSSAQPSGVVPTGLNDVRPGDVLGRYELLIPVAKGGMAQVWAARLKGTRGFQKLVAIKTLLPHVIDDPQFEDMFLDEASLASRVRHPHVVEILDLGEQDGVMYLVMEWVDGEPLTTILTEAAKHGGMPLPIALHVADQACRGLHAAHELRDEGGELLGLVHRDVSPHNVLLSYDGVAKLVDFGIAKANLRMSQETEAGQVKGKAAYMAPEQIASPEAVDRRSDIFAMGILLYMLTTGKHPFRGESRLATLANISSSSRAPPPCNVVASYPPTLQKVVLQALAKDPAKRFPSANEMVIELRRALPKTMKAATDEDVASYMRDLLTARIERRQRNLKEALAAADARAEGRPSIPPPSALVEPPTSLEGTPADAEIAPIAEDPSLEAFEPTDIEETPMSPLGLGSQSRTDDAPEKAKKRWVMIATAVVTTALLLAVSAFALSRNAPEEAAAAKSSDPPLSASAPPPTTASAPPASPELVTFDVTVRPAVRATIHVDGQEVAADGRIELDRAEQPVEIVVTAEGYEEARLEAVPDANRAILVPLTENASPKTVEKKPRPRRSGGTKRRKKKRDPLSSRR